jgi:predicted RNA-binding Zn-ribbon protein involved in translation (DUF1610 family)
LKQRTLKVVRYKIPRRELVLEVMRSMAEEGVSFSSLASMAEEVNVRIKRLNRAYSVSASRCRDLSSGFFDVKAVPSSKRALKDACPVCGEELGVVKNRTINGSEITLSYVCRNCGYLSKGYIRAPARYRFMPKR